MYFYVWHLVIGFSPVRCLVIMIIINKLLDEMICIPNISLAFST